METAADRQSSKRWPIKDWKSLEHQVLGWGGADYHINVCGEISTEV